MKYFGVHLDKKLNWDIHVNKKVNEENSRLDIRFPIMNKKSKKINAEHCSIRE